MKYRKTISITILIITIILDIVCLVALPSTIAVHWDSTGTANNFMPKYQAVLISTAATLFCLWMWAMLCNRLKSTPSINVAFGEFGGRAVYSIAYVFGLIISCSGIVVNIVLILLN